MATSSGCFFAPSRHTVEPYRSDASAAAQLERRAADACGALALPEGIPSRGFITDGCSSFPDGDWADCCVEHDLPYWCGGSREARSEADERLRSCVAAKRSGWLGLAMKLGVRLGGHPAWPAHHRWGYGRDWPSGYEEPRL
jgi:hypothetical protein